MKKIKLKITIDNQTRRIEYILIEGRKLNPNSFFDFENGEWVAEQDNFPLGSDGDLDILIIVAGNPNEKSKMEVFIEDTKKGEYDLFKPFNKNGYAQFNEEI
ncbi:hypothetical protein [Aequorivita nionensis]|uniref:hypothetical protein n=1 Tax=Aequorivita nionensis TaxID=1287690 RepID=UPI00396599B9